MEAGKLRNRITIEQRSATQDSFGQPIDSWTTYATVWASLRPLSGREFITANALSESTNYEIIIRYKAGVTPQMRAKFGVRYFDIQAVLNDRELNKQLTLLCIEGLTDG